MQCLDNFDINNLCNDELSEYLDEVVRVHVTFYPERTLAARLIKISKEFITLEKRDSSTLKVKRRAVIGIEPVKVVI